MEELDEEARLDGGAAGEVQAEQVVTLLLKKIVVMHETRKVCFSQGIRRWERGREGPAREQSECEGRPGSSQCSAETKMDLY